MQAQGCGLERGNIAGVWGHPEGAVSPARPGHGDLAVGVVHQAQGDGAGVLGPGAGTEIHLDGLNADGRGKDGHVIGAVEEVLSHRGDEGILRGRYVLRVLRGERRVGGDRFSGRCPSSLCPFLEKATRAPHMSHPLTTNDAQGTAEHGTAQGLLEKRGREPGRVDGPLGSQRDTSNLDGEHQGTVLILLQLPLPQHDAQDVGRVERQAPCQVRAVPCEMLRSEDGWLGALRVACPNQVQEQWVLQHCVCVRLDFSLHSPPWPETGFVRAQ